MKIFIVEDEKLAFERLKRLIEKMDFNISSISWAKSIKESVTLINTESFDLGFFDIELTDGQSFKIFEQINVQFPIIFTTAYNQHAIKAFKFNSIDYLLKPINKLDLSNAILKFQNVWQQEDTPQINNEILNYLKTTSSSNSHKQRFTIKVGEHIKIIDVSDITLFYSQNKGVYIKTINNRDYVVDYSLDKIIDMICPKTFFKVSRQYILNINFIKDIISYSNSRLKIIMQEQTDEDIIVSREKVKDFKLWIDS